MTIELNITNLIFVLCTLVGAFWAMVKVIIYQSEKSLDTRFKALSTTIEKDQEITRQLERDFMRMQAEMPLHYVRREDYVQAIATIMTKLDAMALRFENILLKGQSREH